MTTSFIKKKCNICNIDDEHLLKRCSVCLNIWYCSKDHQSKDWPSHKDTQCRNLLQQKLKIREKCINGLVESDFSKWYGLAKSTVSGNPKFIVGRYFQYGLGIQVNIIEAKFWYERAADMGSGDAQNALGDLYRHGEGVAVNMQKAFSLYHKSAMQGNSNAQYSLAYCYLGGHGVPLNLKEGFQWLFQCACRGDNDACFDVGKSYYYGYGVPENKEEAIKWFIQASSKGNGAASLKVAKNCLNVHDALHWYMKAGQQGNITAQHKLGCMYGKGETVPIDMLESTKWFLCAAEQGDPESQFHMGMRYRLGIGGLNMDMSQALRWWKRAADQNLSMAQHNLGYAYYSGSGVSCDLPEAFKWFKLAADSGNIIAKADLGKFVVSDADHQFSYRKLVSLTKEGSMLSTESVTLQPTIPHISATYPIKRAKYNGACAISKARSYRAYNIFKGTLTGLKLLEGLRNNVTNEFPIQYLNMSLTTITTGKVVSYNTFILNGIRLKDSADFLLNSALFTDNPPLQLTVTCVCVECQIFRREFTDQDDYYDDIAKLPLLIHPVACECVLCEVCSSDDSETNIKSASAGTSVNESSSDDSDKENH